MEGIPHALGYFTESGHVVGSTHNLDVYFFISISILNLNLNFMSNSTMIKRYCYFFFLYIWRVISWHHCSVS